MLEIIQDIPLFSQLPTTTLMPLFADRQLYVQRYAKGTTVYNEKDHCATLDFVLSGSLAAYALSERGSEMTMFEFSQGQTLGANLLFGNHNQYSFTFYSMIDARILHVTKQAIMALLHDYHFTLHFIELLSTNSQKLNKKITMVTQKTLRENLLAYLKQQAILQKTNCITLPISKKQLADYLGVQRPSLFREIKRLKDEDAITVSNRIIQLHHFQVDR